MKYRPRTGDYIDGNLYQTNRVFDIYDIKTNKKDVPKVKKQAKKQYKYVRVIKRKDGYYILVR